LGAATRSAGMGRMRVLVLHVPFGKPADERQSCELMDSVRSPPPADVPVSLRVIPRFGSIRPCRSCLSEQATLQSSIVRTLCSGSLNDPGSQIAELGSISTNGSCCLVLMGATAAGELRDSEWILSHALARSVGFRAGISPPQAASALLSAATRSGLLRSCSLDPSLGTCSLSSCIGGRPGGNLKSPANCELFGITVAGETVTERARSGNLRSAACASLCNVSGTCRWKERESREL
jgi:hypothetical protein